MKNEKDLYVKLFNLKNKHPKNQKPPKYKTKNYKTLLKKYNKQLLLIPIKKFEQKNWNIYNNFNNK
jgi:hypothetical protein